MLLTPPPHPPSSKHKGSIYQYVLVTFRGQMLSELPPPPHRGYMCRKAQQWNVRCWACSRCPFPRPFQQSVVSDSKPSLWMERHCDGEKVRSCSAASGRAGERQLFTVVTHSLCSTCALQPVRECGLFCISPHNAAPFHYLLTSVQTSHADDHLEV